MEGLGISAGLDLHSVALQRRRAPVRLTTITLRPDFSSSVKASSSSNSFLRADFIIRRFTDAEEVVAIVQRQQVKVAGGIGFTFFPCQPAVQDRQIVIPASRQAQRASLAGRTGSSVRSAPAVSRTSFRKPPNSPL